MRLRDFVPPIIVKLARQLEQRQDLYPSYEDAQRICKNGYEDDYLTSIVYEKTRIYRDSLLKQHPFEIEIGVLRVLIALSLASRDDELNVIDFGGACGAHYYIAKAVFGKWINLRWHVVETGKMVSKASSLQDQQLQFFDSVQKAKSGFDHINLVFSSYALQYVPQPYELLEQLVECKADNLFITRIGLSTLSKELISIQKSNLSDNGPGPMPNGLQDGAIEYPVTFSRKDKFEEILRRNYSIDTILNEEKGAGMAARNSVNMYGYFCSILPKHI